MKTQKTHDQYTTVVGMEIHVELATVSKMFCGCKNDPFGAQKPNIYTCPVCLGLPGALPVPNRKAVEWTLKLGAQLKCRLATLSKFDRKNYFYPDLPKGYQISQYDQPLCTNGRVETAMGDVGITRVHLEEDTGKLLHKNVDGKDVSLVDFNRSGVPLVEIVTEPDITSGAHAKLFLKTLHQIIVDLGISQAKMQEGSMRLEPNISVKKASESGLPAYKVEVKNINSFNFVKKAIEYEVDRHIELLGKGTVPKQETRGWNEDRGVSVSQRSKEEAADYRYFPEPDIPPLTFEQSYLDSISQELPQLPLARQREFEEFGLSPALAQNATQTIERTNLLKETYELLQKKNSDIPMKTLVDWVMNKKIDEKSVAVSEFARLVTESLVVQEVAESEVENALSRIMEANPQAVADVHGGKQQAIGFLFGQLLKELKGKGDKKKLMSLLRSTLSS